MLQHIIITTEDPISVYNTKQEIAEIDPDFVYQGKEPKVIYTHLVCKSLGLDSNFKYDLSKNNRRLDILISEDGLVEVKSNFIKKHAIEQRHTQL